MPGARLKRFREHARFCCSQHNEVFVIQLPRRSAVAIFLAPIFALVLAGCGPQALEAPESQAKPRAASSALVLPSPTFAGNGPAVKAVCCNANKFHGADPLSQAAALLNGQTALQVPAAPPTALNVASFALGSALDLSNGGSGTGLFPLNIDAAKIFGSAKSNWAGSFAGYVKIDPSSDGSAVQKSFTIASDDGFRFAVSDGTDVHTSSCDQGRGMSTFFAGTNYYAGCGNPIVASTMLTVTFPGTGGLFPFSLLYFNTTGDQGLELSWADGAPAAPEAGKLNGFALVPADHLYAPAVRATMTASDANSMVQPGDTLTYTVAITNTGNAPLSSYTFAVRVDPTRLTGLAGGFGGSCSNSNGLLVCPLSTVLNPGDSTGGTFTAKVASGLVSNTVIDVQGVVTGLATTADVATQAGGAGEVTAGEIYALTDDPNVVAGSNFQSVDTGNTPSGFASSTAVGAADDDATRVVVGQAPEAPPTITGPLNPSTSDVLLTVSGTSHAPAGTSIQVQVNLAASPTSAPAYTCTATTGATGNWNCAPVAFADGSYLARARLLDSGGNSGPWSTNYPFTVQSPAAPTIVQPSNNQPIHSSSIAIAGTSAEPDGQTIRVTVSSVEAGPMAGGGATCSAPVLGGHWTCTVSLPDGGYAATAAVVEVSGALGTASNSVAFTVTTGGACGSTIQQTASPTNNKRPTFTGTSAGGSSVEVCEGGTSACGSGSTVLCTVAMTASAGGWQCTASADLADGVHTVVAVASSGATICPSNNDVFTVDTTPPAAPGFDQPTSPTSQTRPAFTGTGIAGDTIKVGSGGGGLGTILCTAVVTAQGTWTCTSSALTDGTYQLQAVQLDPAGNQSPATSRTLIVNTSRPDAPTLSGPPSPTKNPRIAFSGTSDSGTTVQVRDANNALICTSALVVASSSGSDGSWSCTSSALADSTYVFSAVAYSNTNVGSPGSVPLTITVDTTAPARPILDAVPSPTAQHFPLFAGTAEAGSVVAIFEGATQLCSGPSAGTFSCVSGTSLPNGAHTVFATATVSPHSLPVSFLIDDTSAPAPTLDPLAMTPGAQAGYTSQTQPTFTGTGVPGDLVTVRLSTGETVCNATVDGNGAWTCASVLVLVGVPATTYSVEAVQQAPAGTHVLSPASPRISFTVDTHTPRAPELDPPMSPSSNHAPSFTGTAEAGNTVEVSEATLGLLCSTTADSHGAYSCGVSMALPDGTYSLTARSYSPAAVPSPVSSPARILTLFTPSALLAPTLAAPMSPTNHNRPTFTGTAASGVNVSVVSSGQTLCTGPVVAGKWECATSAALADGTYVLTARASNAQGDLSPPSASVALVIDTAPPAAPIILIPVNGADLENPTVTSGGTAEVAAEVALTLDGAAFGSTHATTTGSWALALGLLEGGTHTLSATATDLAGNTGPASTITFLVQVPGTVRGGCASGGVPTPVIAFALLLWFFRSRRRSRGPRVAAGLAMVGIAIIGMPTAFAQSIDLGRLHPASDGEGMIGVEGARPPIDGESRMQLNLWIDGAFQPLTFHANRGGSTALVTSRFESFLGAQLRLWRPFSLAVQMPFLLGQTGDLTALPASARPTGSLGGAIGDLRITPRVSILRQETSAFDLGGELSLTLPTAGSSAYAGDSRAQFEALAAAGRHLVLDDQDFEVLGNLLVRLRESQQILDVKVGNEVGVRLAFAWLPEKTSDVMPRRIFLEAEGAATLSGSFGGGTVPAEWRAGASFCAAQAVSLDVGAGSALGNGLGSPRARVIFGLGYAPEVCGPPGRDRYAARPGPRAPIVVAAPQPTPLPPTKTSEATRAATVSHVELKPAEPAPAPVFVAAPPSSAPIVNAPFVPAPVAPAPATQVAAAHADELSLPDLETAPLPLPPLPSALPPAAPSVTIVHPAPGNSAPPANNPDEDLPLAPLIALNGAPPSIVAPVSPGGSAGDRDGDGIPDARDSCPDQAGTRENHGCPQGAAMRVAISPMHLSLDAKLAFRPGSAALDKGSLPLVQQLASVLKDHPELTHLTIRAHTDGSLGEARSKELSQDRAETIVKMLRGDGVEGSRLAAQGMGMSQPVAPNVTAGGRKKNDRVELLVK
jgi:outer membrane protein OmpA-like peptidoglycan-associated protein